MTEEEIVKLAIRNGISLDEKQKKKLVEIAKEIERREWEKWLFGEDIQ